MGTINLNTPITFADPLPEAADVVVVGAGVIGVSTAYFLAEQGLRVVVCEKGRVAGEQSSRNWGWVRQQGRDTDELPIMMESRRIWQGLAARIGEDPGYREHGVMYLAENEAELADVSQWLGVARTHDVDTRLLGQSEIEAMIEGRPGQWVGATYTASDGRAEPWLAVPALARGAQRLGAVIREDCAVRALDLSAGRVSGVVTEHRRITAQAVLVAAGAWSSLLLRNHGVRLPQLTVRATVARTAPGPLVFAGNAADEKLAFRRREDGGYTLALGDFHEHFVGPDSVRHLKTYIPSLRASWSHTALHPSSPAGFPDGWRTARRWSEDERSPFEAMRVLNPAPNSAAVTRMVERLAQRLPALAGIAVIDSWAGMIDAMPDVVPVMDRLLQHDGLWIATGFSGHGFGIGPAAGRIMAELIQGRDPGHDLSRFRFTRFTDGSKLRLGPSL